MAYTYKAIYDYNIYLDDLELEDKYANFIKDIKKQINSKNQQVIVIHHRGNDPWNRHLSNSLKLNESLLHHLLAMYSDHIIVLLGESWKYIHHPRIKYLDNFINKSKMIKHLGEYSTCLKYILSAFYCRDADILFVGISGFTLFIESIRPLNLMPPIPTFWGKETFSGNDTCIQMNFSNFCKKLEAYNRKNPFNKAFKYQVHHFLYYSRDEELLKSYCFDFPNNINKIFNVLKKLELKYRKIEMKRKQISNKSEFKNDLPFFERMLTFFINKTWNLKQNVNKLLNKYLYF